MIGGGIFSILGVSVQQVGNATPIAILVGGVLAFFAAFSYVKLAQLYKDEGATYSFFKKTFPQSTFASSAIGWLIVFGYTSTLALYAFTFASYLGSVLPFEKSEWLNKIMAGGIIAVFAVINLVSVKGMGKVEDWLVYTKLVLLLFISAVLVSKGEVKNITPVFESHSTPVSILIVSAITFVAYEGFQLVIHAYHEMDEPQKNIPRAIYISIAIATTLYVFLSVAAISAIPKQAIIQNKEHALAAGAQQFLGTAGLLTVVFGALLATSSAISGTIFGASRLAAVIAADGYLPGILARKHKVYIPGYAIVTMSVLAFILILSGGLQTILEFGSITFIVVSFLMAFANYNVRNKTATHIFPAVVAMVGLAVAGILIFYFEYSSNPKQLIYTGVIYATLIFFAFLYSRHKTSQSAN